MRFRVKSVNINKNSLKKNLNREIGKSVGVRNKAFQVFDLENPIQKADIEAKDLDDAWKIWFEKYMLGNTNKMKELNILEIVQLKHD